MEGKEISMRYGYWWIAAVLGVVLIIAPFVGKFTELHVAAYTDVIVGAVLLVWTLVGYWYLGEMKGREGHPTQA